MAVRVLADIFFLRISRFNNSIIIEMNKDYENKQQLSHAALLELEVEYISSSGPTLGHFASDIQKHDIFQEIDRKQSEQQVCIRLQNDSNSNIRAFYYCLLNLLYEKENWEGQAIMETRFKQFVYSPATKLDLFDGGLVESKYKPYYKDSILKKIMVQFLHVAGYSRGPSNIYKMLNKYPILDFVFVLTIRALLLNKYKDTSALDLQVKVNTMQLVRLFQSLFKITIISISPQQHLFELNQLIVNEYARQTRVLTYTLNNILESYVNICQPQPEINNIPINGFSADESFREDKSSACDTSINEEMTPQFKSLLNHNHNQIMKKSSFAIKSESLLQSNEHLIIQEEANQESPTLTSNPSPQRLEDSFHIKLKELFQEDLPTCQFKIQPTTTRMHPTIQEAKNQFEFNMYDGMTSPQILSTLSPSILKSVNEKKQISIQSIYQKKKLIKDKRYSLITPHQFDSLFDNNLNVQSPRLMKQSRTEKSLLNEGRNLSPIDYSKSHLSPRAFIKYKNFSTLQRPHEDKIKTYETQKIGIHTSNNAKRPNMRQKKLSMQEMPSDYFFYRN